MKRAKAKVFSGTNNTGTTILIKAYRKPSAVAEFAKHGVPANAVRRATGTNSMQSHQAPIDAE